MKKSGLLNQPISNIIAGMGHMDTLVVADAGLPIPHQTTRIDLAVTKGVPPFLEVLQAVLGELEVQQAIIAEEIVSVSPEMHRKLLTLLEDIPLITVTHDDFKRQTAQAHAVVRTGEFTPYANVILVAGVVF